MKCVRSYKYDLPVQQTGGLPVEYYSVKSSVIRILQKLTVPGYLCTMVRAVRSDGTGVQVN